MNLHSGIVCLISGGRTENLGKVVYIVGPPEDPRLPDLGGEGRHWDIQMVSGELTGSDGNGYLRGKIGEKCLSPQDFTMEQARDMRERGLAKIVEQAMTELFKEELWGEAPE
jgi:hypothetical protein